MKKLLFGVFLSASTLSAFATAVRSLPEPDADGYYVFGAPYTYSGTTSYEWKADANAPAYPVWSGMVFPAGAKVRLTGGVIIDSWPTGVSEVDCSALTFMAITATKAIPSGVKIVIPAGAKLCVCKGTLTVGDADAVTFAEAANSAIELPFDLELDGTLCWHKNTLTFSGELSGSGSIPSSTQMNSHLVFSSSVDFSGSVIGAQGSQNIKLSGSPVAFGYVYSYGKDSSPSYFLCNPAKGSSVSVEVFRAAGALYADGVRKSTFFCVANGNVASLGVLGGVGCHFITQTEADAVQRDDVGDATVLIDNLDPRYDTTWPSGQKTTDCYFSKNMSYSIAAICRGGTSTTCNGKRVSIHYEAESGNNTNVLSVGSVPSGSSTRWMEVGVSGVEPASLPRLMTLPQNAGLAGGVDVAVTGDAWAFDFDWTKDDPNLSRCEIAGAKNAAIPERGTIAITTVGKPGAKAVYPLFTCNVGCAALADAAAWPVTINGTLVEGDEFSDGTAKYRIIRSETGIYLQASIVKGLMLIFR